MSTDGPKLATTRCDMSQISRSVAFDLVHKLFSESTPVVAFLLFASGTSVQLRGFIDGATRADGILVSTTRPAPEALARILLPVFRQLERDCEYAYGERRELPPQVAALTTSLSEYEAVLTFRFLDSGEFFGLFFNV